MTCDLDHEPCQSGFRFQADTSEPGAFTGLGGAEDMTRNTAVNVYGSQKGGQQYLPHKERGDMRCCEGPMRKGLCSGKKAFMLGSISAVVLRPNLSMCILA